MDIWIYMWEPRTTALGPGVRFALWTQGCDKRCKGCISPHSRVMLEGEKLTTEFIAEQMLADDETEGMTISGGEPFLQAGALCKIIEEVRTHRDFGVIIYTGYVLSELREKHDVSVDRLLDYCDLLIDGPYMEELNDGKSLRGSSNQQVIPLSGRYEKYLDMYGSQGRKIEVYIRGGKTRILGIPSRDEFDKLGLK
ncbi:hypothetical protein FACS1894216_13560 [Synergistales bacterium]|nr:hypothetical protein FACS1894216_13560 [Synergistales bacterium]